MHPFRDGTPFLLLHFFALYVRKSVGGGAGGWGREIGDSRPRVACVGCCCAFTFVSAKPHTRMGWSGLHCRKTPGVLIKAFRALALSAPSGRQGWDTGTRAAVIIYSGGTRKTYIPLLERRERFLELGMSRRCTNGAGAVRYGGRAILVKRESVRGPSVWGRCI